MSNKILLFPLVIITLLLSYYFFKQTPCVAFCPTSIITINASEFKKKVSEQDTIILDVRTPDEYKTGHLSGSINLDFNNRTSFTNSLKSLDKNKTYLVYCRSGNRSSQAVDLMAEQGFTDLVNLEGGIISWQAADLPTIK